MTDVLKLTFDSDGYPTEDALGAIRHWDVWNDDRAALLMREVAAAWHGPRAEETSPGLWVFATGGWSGNESLMDAVNNNYSFCAMWDNLYLRGGLHIFAVTRASKMLLNRLLESITAWAWSGGATNSEGNP